MTDGADIPSGAFTVAVTGGRELLKKKDDPITVDTIEKAIKWATLLALEFNDAYTPAMGCPLVVIQGGAKGADWVAMKVAEAMDIPCFTFKADWNQYGKGAGPIRNEAMAQVADVVIALPGGSGTADMVKRSNDKGLHVINHGKK